MRSSHSYLNMYIIQIDRLGQSINCWWFQYAFNMSWNEFIQLCMNVIWTHHSKHKSVHIFFVFFFVWNLHTGKAQNQIEIVWTEERVSSHTLTHAHPFIPNHLYQYLCTLEHIKTDSFFTVRWHHAFTGTHTHTLSNAQPKFSRFPMWMITLT